MWTYNGIRIFIQNDDSDGSQIIARLQPIDYKTIYHTFGYESIIKKLKGYVVGGTDASGLLTLRTTGNAYTLSGYGTSLGNFYLHNISLKPIHTVCQTLRPDLDEDEIVYELDLELYYDE